MSPPRVFGRMPSCGVSDMVVPYGVRGRLRV